MTDRKHTQLAPGQWAGVPSQYSASQNYATSNYQVPSSHQVPSHTLAPAYETLPRAVDVSAYPNAYYSSHPYPPSSAPSQGYIGQGPATTVSGRRQSQDIPRPQSTRPHISSHSHHQTYSQMSQPMDMQSRGRSYSQVQSHPISPVLSNEVYNPTSQHNSTSHMASLHKSSSQYPATPSRPFSCDLCALSFNRQHDLKRHRETHNGEKPFLCNGGCGKTFTRKDALKRHQLVKGCGRVDDSWS